MGRNKAAIPKHFSDCMFNLQAEGSKSYFSNCNISEWNFEDYANHFAAENLSHDTIKNNYNNDLIWLLKCDLPREVISYIGRLQKKFREDKDNTIRPQQKPNSTIVIQGDNSCMVNNGTINNNSKRPYNDDNDNDSAPVNKQQKTTDAVDDFFSNNISHHSNDECVSLPDTNGVLAYKEIHIGEEPKEDCSELAKKFYHYKKAVKELAKKKKLFYDTHVNEVMTLNHCLLLKRHQYSGIQKQIFDPDFLASIHSHILNENCSYGSEVDIEFSLDDPVPNVIIMLKNVNKLLCDYEPFTFQYRFIRCIQNIPETNAKERACRTKRVARQDAVLSKIDSLSFSGSKMFGEVKGGDANDQLCAIDLVRLAKFAKDTIDTTRIDKVMVFHAVANIQYEMYNLGTSVTFYNVLLYDEGVYVVAELHKISLPTSQQEAPKLLDQIDKLYNIYIELQKTSTLDADFFDRCTRETTDTPVLDQILEKSQAKRVCLVHFN
ncbi:hypothetical protein INT45_001340 [Circinella minor]|uniref:Uncharacterized protein n=1 Tax=Circinella minor TaxID=1195481 RepID=A0A8H7S7H1_9FUNG|nr:hypothetical protein INT45_001340 [Circinella minor]